MPVGVLLAVGRTIITRSLIVLQYNDEQLPVARIDGLGGVSSYQYDPQGRTIAHIDAAGNTTRWEYDAFGNVLAQTLADRSAIATAYDADHRPVAITDPEGGVWKQTWDARGNLLERAGPGEYPMYYRWDWKDRLLLARPKNMHTTVAAN